MDHCRKTSPESISTQITINAVQAILVDIGVLLRAFDRSSLVQKTIFKAFRKQWDQGNLFATSRQNIAEFWNVATRPASACGGFGLSVDETLKRVQTMKN